MLLSLPLKILIALDFCVAVNDLDWPLLFEVSSRITSLQAPLLPFIPTPFLLYCHSFFLPLPQGRCNARLSGQNSWRSFFVIMTISFTHTVHLPSFQRPLYRGGIPPECTFPVLDFSNSSYICPFISVLLPHLHIRSPHCTPTSCI